MPSWQQTALGTLVVAPLLAIATGCAAQPAEPDPPVATPPARVAPAPAPAAPVDGCPVLPTGAGGSSMIIDYIDFLQHDGRQYIAGLTEVPPVSSTQLGQVVLVSRCSFTSLNDSTNQDPGPPRDGDTAFLPPGTAIHAVDGWEPECRLAAERDGRIHVYLAQEPNGKRAGPAPCALD